MLALPLFLLSVPARAAVVEAVPLRSVLPVLSPTVVVAPSLGRAALAPALSAPLLTIPAPAAVPAPAVAAALPAPAAVAAAISAAANVPSFDPKVQPAAAGLAATVQAVSRAPGQAGSRLGEFFSGSAPGSLNGVSEDEAAFVRVNRERKAEALQVAHARRELFDYRRGAFSAARAQEFAAKVLPFHDEQAVTGRDLLQMAMTPHAVHLDVPLDPAHADLGRFGVGERELREKAAAAGWRHYAVSGALEEAYRQGLVYRLHDEKGGHTLYGVPYEVRSVLKLTLPEAPAPAPAAKPSASPVGRATLELLARSEGADPELKEYVLQLAVAAVEAGQLAEAELPKGTMERWRALRLASTSFGPALLTVVEASHGGPLASDAKALAGQAAAAGLVDAGELGALLRDLR